MITKVTECPICFREYETNPKTCACGFSELRYVDFFSNASEERRAGQWFDIYKYAKRSTTGRSRCRAINFSTKHSRITF